MDQKKLFATAVELLKSLIATPSTSRGEQDTADLIERHLAARGMMNINRLHNNVWVFNRHFDKRKPTLLLNSHHDTVAPNSGYTRNPYSPDIEDGKLYGLGSNDAGASAVSLISAFAHFYDREHLPWNLCLAVTAEEEVSGPNGIESVLPHLGELSLAIVGEPTGMQMAIGERGLVVLDCVARGASGHAAREEGDNAIYRAIKDIEWFRDYRFPKKSELFGDVKMSVTVINAGTQHNVVPAECHFTVDIRVTDRYSNLEIVETVRENIGAEVTPRSTRLKPSYIDPSHPLVQAGIALGLSTYGSPTTSDQSLLDIPSLKIGVGDSCRSHTSDEYVLLSEIEEGIDLYIKLLDRFFEVLRLNPE